MTRARCVTQGIADASAGETVRLLRAVPMLARLAPKDIDVHLAHARVAEEVGPLAMAEELYEEVRERFPFTPQSEPPRRGWKSSG